MTPDPTRPTHFTVSELVDPWFLTNFTEDECWQKLDPSLFPALEWLREKFGPLLINGKGYTESGLRRSDTKTGSAKSAHKLGQAYDIKPLRNGVTVQTMYAFILANQSEAYAHGMREVEDIRDTTTSNACGGWLHISSRFGTPALNKIRVIQP